MFALLNFSLHLLLDLFKGSTFCYTLFNQPVSQQLQRITFRLPLLFLFFRAIITALDVTNVVSKVAVRIAEHKSWSLTLARTRNQALRRSINCANILAIHLSGQYAKSPGSATYPTAHRLRIVATLAVQVLP